MTLFSACNQTDELNCSELNPSAQFNVNTTEFTALQEIAWLSTGAQNSLLFMQQQPNGDQHVVNVIFVGDTVGTYPLLGINAIHRASYFAPGINGTTFPDTVLPGTLVITNFEEEPTCLSGNFTFRIDTLEVSGEFEHLRVD